MDYTVLDCPDPAALADFYARLLGWNIVRADDHWQVVEGSSTERMAFQRAADFTPVDWPADGVGIHLDLTVDSFAPAQDWAIGLGASLVEDDAEHPGFRVYRDPAGHYFCLCLRGE